ncbi:MAG: DUF4286 family protein [Mediterranea sp.]|jgi:hypothetical protein|nr:DUF4286 family protein [Mediterranea sp.]
MLIYNTTFHAEDDVHHNFLIWLQESYIPGIERASVLKSPRLCRLLNFHDEGTAYSLQWEVESSACLHRWYAEQGLAFNGELEKIFRDRVVGFSTLMEVIACNR